MAVWLGALLSVAEARWEGAEDNRTAAELAAMEEEDLFVEAFDVCTRRAGLLAVAEQDEMAVEGAREATDYLSLMETVLREGNEGRLPLWMRQLSFARTARECRDVFQGYVTGEAGLETKEAVKPSATSRPRPPVRRTERPRPPATVRSVPARARTPRPGVLIPAPTGGRQTGKAAPAPAVPASQDAVTDELPPWLRRPR